MLFAIPDESNALALAFRATLVRPEMKKAAEPPFSAVRLTGLTRPSP